MVNCHYYLYNKFATSPEKCNKFEQLAEKGMILTAAIAGLAFSAFAAPLIFPFPVASAFTASIFYPAVALTVLGFITTFGLFSFMISISKYKQIQLEGAQEQSVKIQSILRKNSLSLGDLEKCFEIVNQIGEWGNPSNLHRLAMIYFYGKKSVAKNEEKAIELLKTNAKKNYEPSQLALSVAFLKLSQESPNSEGLKAKAFKHFEAIKPLPKITESSSFSDRVLVLERAMLHLENLDTGLETLKNLAQQGNIHAIEWLQKIPR